MVETTKIRAIKELVQTCQGLISEKGTIYLSKESMALQNCVRNAILKCFSVGICTDFINKVISKYGHNQKLPGREDVA
jgi:hypothetical protein